MAETITLSSLHDGFELSAFHEVPFVPRKGGVIVLQEIFGIDRHVRADVERWAKAGWEAVAPAEAVAEHLWVALKHEISYRRPAFLEDGLVAEVIAERMHGARSYFTTFIRRGEELLAEVRSSWCCLDSTTHRPARLARDVVERFLPARQAAIAPAE